MLRGTRYSGDGGVDGAVWLPGRGRRALQAKRYRHHVSLAHVCAFGDGIAERGYDGGLFVRTGRSGAALYPQMDTSLIGLLSGNRLLRLMRERYLEDRSSRAMR